MLENALSAPNKSQAKTSRSLASVFELETNCLATGHHGNSFSIAENLTDDVTKTASQKHAIFFGKHVFTVDSNRVLKTKKQSARFVQLPESQMERKASVTPSPFGRGLLLGRGAFLF
jgi:hypothetical protein